MIFVPVLSAAAGLMKKLVTVCCVVLVLAVAALIYLKKARSKHPFEKRPNIVLIVIDALRADHLSCYGYKLKTTPNIDDLQKRGTLFEQFFVPLPMTQPSFASLFTSLHPLSHGVRQNGKALSPKARTLASILQDNGYVTAAVVGAFNLDSRFGLNQGFQFYDDVMNPKDSDENQHKRWERRASEVNRVAFEWMSRRDQAKPFFLFVHYFELHKSYGPSGRAHRKQVDAVVYQEKIIEQYDREIAVADASVGQILEALRANDLLERSLIILTADHGQGLGDHDWYGHIWRLYDEAVRVPLILAGPKIPRNQRVGALLQNTDIAPTVLDYLDIRPPVPFQGQSFLDTLNGTDEIREYVLLEKAAAPVGSRGFGGWKKFPHAQWAIRTSTEKFIWSEDERHEFYDLRNDPGELSNLFEPGNERALSLYRRGLKYRGKFPPLHLAVEPSLRPEDEMKEGLRALGYTN
jgi:arylsulfatase A-like enzyme